jgi:hypothetical protein
MPEEDDNGGGGGFGLGTGDTFLDAVGAVLIILLLVQLAQNLPGILSNSFGGIWESISGVGGWPGFYTGLYTLAVIFSLACITGIVYASMQLSRVRRAERRELKNLTQAAISGEDTHNERWQQILSYAASDDHELWRLAIIEADVMLDEMLRTMGYQQDSLGGKLRSVERSDFQTIDKAWEAHKVRNSIAHEGSTYDLNRRELERTINNYRQVFTEFSYI